MKYKIKSFMLLHKAGVQINQAKSKLNFISKLFTETTNTEFHTNLNTNLLRSFSQDNSVSIVAGYGLDNWTSVPGRVKRFFPIPQHSDWLCSPPPQPPI
jgi:hypothetical protein